MKLPKRDLPQYSVELPATGVTVKYRPHTVKEEQILNMAMMSDEDKDKIEAVFQITENCVDYDIQKLFPAEVELLFMKIRATSDTSVIPVVYHIDKTEEDADGKLIHNEDCPDTINSAFDINKDVKVVVDEKAMGKYATKAKTGGWIIKLDDDLKMVINIRPLVDVDDDSLYELLECVIVEKEGGEEDLLYKDVDFTQEEFRDWVEGLPSNAFDKFSKFMEHIPKCQATLKFKCKCGHQYKEAEEGILRFLV